MKTLFRPLDAIAFALMALSALVTAALYHRLPAQVPTHFDLHGVPNGWMSRPWGAWFTPALMLALWSLLRTGPALLPAAWQRRLIDSPTALVAALLIGLLSGLHGISLYAALTPSASVGTALGVLLSTFWFVFGLILPRVRRNPWVGIRTAWTLSSDENWAQTHRFAGFSFCVGGLLAGFCALTLGPSFSFAIILASALVPAVYSYVVARRLPPEA